MKTNIKNFVKKIDEAIPEATTETVMDQCAKIGRHAGDTGKCAMAALTCIGGTAIYAYRTLEDSVMLGLMLSKTSTKMVINGAKEYYNATPAMAVIR